MEARSFLQFYYHIFHNFNTTMRFMFVGLSKPIVLGLKLSFPVCQNQWTKSNNHRSTISFITYSGKHKNMDKNEKVL